MNMAEASEMLGVHACTVTNLIKAGDIAGAKSGPRQSSPYEISRESVVAFLAAQKIWPRPCGHIPRPVHERLFAQLLIDPSGCLLWTGGRNPKGYGRINVGGRAGGYVGVHRVMYELFAGPVPEGLELDHLCRVRHCANVAHLEAVTHAENLRRGAASRRMAAAS